MSFHKFVFAAFTCQTVVEDHRHFITLHHHTSLEWAFTRSIENLYSVAETVMPGI